MQGWWNTKHNNNWEKQKLINSFLVHGCYNFVHEDKLEHYILAIVSLRYARKMQVGCLAELLYTLFRKKFKPSNKSHTADPHPFQSSSVFLVLTSHWAKIKRLLAKENFEFLKNWHTENKPESFDGWLSTSHGEPHHESRSSATRWLPAACPRRVPAPGAPWPSLRRRSGRGPSAAPPGSSRCQHSSAAPARPPPAPRASGRASASLSATFVFLISFYFKVYQLLYYQAELSLRSLPLSSSSFPFFLFLETINVSGPSCHCWFFITV